MIDTRFIGHELDAFEVAVEAGRLRLFSKATHQPDPVYFDEKAARAAGHPALPVPLSFLFCLEMDGPNPSAMRDLLGLDFRSLLHGEQGFIYHRMAYAGDVLRFEPRIDNIYAKKGGALEFIERSTRVTNQRGEAVAELKFVLVVRHPKGAAA